jgi:hypothetical protein
LATTTSWLPSTRPGSLRQVQVGARRWRARVPRQRPSRGGIAARVGRRFCFRVCWLH